MPFPEQTPRLFIREGIEALTPDQTGCYGIYSGSTCICVGKGDIRGRLLDRLAGGSVDTGIHRENPTHFVTVLSDNPDELEKELILELDPICNKQVG